MLTAHECIRALSEIRAATPLVTYRWPHTPDAVRIEAGRLTIFLNQVGHRTTWLGWTMLSEHFDDEAPWPRHLDNRFFDEIEAALIRAGAEGGVERSSFCRMPF